MKKLMFVNVCIDEDGYVIIEDGEIESYKWRGYIRNEEYGCSRVVDNVEEVRNEMLKGGVNSKWFNDEEFGKIEKEKLIDGLLRIEGLFCGGIIGMLISWSVEYDDNLMLLYEVEIGDEDEGDEYIEGCVSGEVWYNREYDESELEI